MNKCIKCYKFPFCIKARGDKNECEDFIKRGIEYEFKRERKETEKEIPREDLFLKKTFL